MAKASINQYTAAQALSASFDPVANTIATTGGSGTSATDGGTFTAGSDSAVPMEGVYESSPSSVASGKYGVVGIDSTRNQKIVGSVASGTTDSGAPIKIGGVGKTAIPTAVTDGQRVDAYFTKTGKQVTTGALRESIGVTQTQISNSTSETTIVAAVASTFCDLYGLILANTGATTTKVTIKDATAGTTRAIIEVPTLETRGFMLPVDSGIPQAVVNNNWTATCASATTALEVTALWVKNI